MAVVHLAFVEDVAQRIPVRGRLDRHVDGVVGVGSRGCRPASASVPVASMVWIGFQRLPNRPRCGPLWPSGMPSAKVLPRLMSRPAATTSAGVTWLSVPI